MKLCLTVLSLVISLAGCEKPASGPAGAGPGMHTSLKNGQTFYSGTEQRFYTLEKGQTGALKISVQAESGNLSISVFPTADPDHFCYRGREIPTSDFSVTLSDAGDYTVWIETDRFAGSYKFDWTTDGKE